MNDREFLIWIHERLVKFHNEDPLMDYMHKLRAIIASMPEDRETPNIALFNSVEELREDETIRIPSEATETTIKTLRDIADILESGEAHTIGILVHEVVPDLMVETRTGRQEYMDIGNRVLRFEYWVKQPLSIYSGE